MSTPTPLWSEEAEKAVVSSMFLWPETCIDEAGQHLKESHFRDPKFQMIFKTLMVMKHKRVAIDPPTLHQFLIDYGVLEQVGGAGILADLMGYGASRYNLGSYIKIVREKAMRRNLAESLSEISKAIQDEDDAEALIALTEQKIGASLAGIETDTLRSAAQVAADLRANLTAAVANRGKLSGIPTGIPKMDTLTNGWQPSKVILIAGRPGHGKSVSAENFAFKAATEGFGVGIVTLEMSSIEHAERTMAHEAEVSTVRQTNGDLNQEEIDKLLIAQDRFATLPIFYEDCPKLSIFGLCAKFRRLVYKHKIKLGVLDYLTLVESDSEKDDELAKARKIMRAIKSLARELKIPIIVLAQLNRSGAQASMEGEPELHHIRSAGEDDADIAILLHRHKDRTPQQIERDLYPTKFKIAKHRGGPTGFIETMLDAVHNKFHPL